MILGDWSSDVCSSDLHSFPTRRSSDLVEFFENIKGDEAKELKGEYLLPIYIDELLKKGKVSVKLLETQDKWFGVTYKEDKPVVVESFAKLIADGVYRKDLFSDLQA